MDKPRIPAADEIKCRSNRNGEMRYYGPSLDGFDGTARGWGFRSPSGYRKALWGWREKRLDQITAKLGAVLDSGESDEESYGGVSTTGV